MLNENQIYDNYLEGITRVGRATMLLGMLATLLPALLMTFYFGYNPGISAIIAGAVCQISVSGAFWFSEPISYYPIVGRAGLYMGFLSGNMVNLRIPAAIAAQQGSGMSAGTNKGSVMGTIGIGVSIWVAAIFLTLSIIAGEALLSKVPASFMTVLSLIIPATLWRNIYTICYKISKNRSFCSYSMLYNDASCKTSSWKFLIPYYSSSCIFVYFCSKKSMDKELKKKE